MLFTSKSALEPSFQIRFTPLVANTLQQSSKIALLATNEYEGIFKNGGVGTYYKKLSESLASEGWDVILLLCYVEEAIGGSSSFPAVKHVFSTFDVEKILDIQETHQTLLAEVKHNPIDRQSYRCLLFIQALANHFKNSVIYVEFHEMIGIGYHTIQAKRTNLLPQNCITGVTLHSGHEWIFEANEKYTHDYLDWLWQTSTYEQYCFENADLAFFPSYHLKMRVESYGWRTDHAIHMPNYIPVIQLTNLLMSQETKQDSLLVKK